MYQCERCGTRYRRQTPVVEVCPRCLARNGERVPLVYKLFGDLEPPRTSAVPAAALQARSIARLPATASKSGDRDSATA